jgi:protein-tyrosine phosphatase
MSIIIHNLILSSISEIQSNNNIDLMKNTELHINAAEEIQKFNSSIKNEVVSINLNWYDSPVQDINKNCILFHLIKMIDTYISCGKQVLVNCFAGVSRSATIVVAYFMYKNKWGVQDAISFVRSKRWWINPNYGFICQLYNLQDKLHYLDENFNKYCSEFENKTSEQIINEIGETSKIPFIQQIQEREYSNFEIPVNINNPFL